MAPGMLEGCSRGVYGLSTWDPPRPPHSETLQQLGITDRHDSLRAPVPGSVNVKSSAAGVQLPASLKRRSMIAKYTYTANADSPLGHELSVKKGDMLNFLKSHKHNNNWWLAENADGEVGYVPMSYMLMMDERLEEQAWLQKLSEKQQDTRGRKTFGVPQKVT